MLALSCAVLLLIQPMASASNPGLPSAAVPPELQVSEGFDGSSVQLVRGQALLLTLPSNPTTGYGWELAAPDPGVLKESRAPEMIPGTGAPGAAGVTRFRFMAVGAGSATLKLNYRRGFEPASIPPLKRFALQVLVR
jgi:inhibitor of cysteine peptidase